MRGRVRVRVMARVWVTVEVRFAFCSFSVRVGGNYFLRLHTPLSMARLMLGSYLGLGLGEA